MSETPTLDVRRDPADTAAVMSRWARTLLGLYLYGLVPVLIYGVVCLWLLTEAPSKVVAQLNLLGLKLGVLSGEQALMWFIAALGALGGSIHAAKSFSVFAGNRNLVSSWLWWYLARAPVGAALALALYLALRGGLLAAGQGAASFNVYGLGAIAVLTGLFSEVATDKLREVFEVLFRPAEHKKDPLDAKAPVLLEILPGDLKAGSGPAKVALSGRDFDSTDEVLLEGKKIGSTFINAKRLEVTIPSDKLQKPGQLSVAVHRAGPAGLASQTLSIEVKEDQPVSKP